MRCKEILYLLSYRLAENTHFVKLLKREDLRLSNNKLNSRQKSTLVQVLNSELEEFVTNEVLLLQNFDIYKELNNPLNKDSNLK